MKWFIGIAAVMLITHLYFRRGIRKAERKKEKDQTR